MKSAKLFIAVLLFSAFLFAQTTPNLSLNTIYVGADGKFESAPDTAVITFGISAQADTSQDAYNRASRSAEQIRDLLRKNGIEPKAAEVGYFSLQPVYDYRSPKRKLIGYRANSSVTLKLKDFGKVGPTLQGLSDMDITDNQQVSYVLDNIDQAKVKAAQDALQRARQEAAAVASTGGRTLGEMVYASVDTYEPPRPIPMVHAMAAEKAGAPEPTAEFSAQKITVTAHVNALFALK
jgi:uncharacterized protein YggE